jgi:predicted MFS family arabinose efflux permease
MSYFHEFRLYWRAVVAAGLGSASGLSLRMYTASLFAPYLLADFGWTKAEFALTNLSYLLIAVCVPIGGRLGDVMKTHHAAAIGVVTIPLLFLAFSRMSGSIIEFFILYSLLNVLGATATAAIYNRPIVERFDKARGAALAIALSGPPAIAAVGIPLLRYVIDEKGWRTGYLSVAIFAAALGCLALILMPKNKMQVGSPPPRRCAKHDYGLIMRSRAFWILMSGMLICHLSLVIPYSQISLILFERGVASATAGYIISCYAAGGVFGKLCFGFALDRWPSHIVAAIGLGMPCVGFLILLSGTAAPWPLGFAMLVLGVSQGAEGDVICYLASRFFGMELFGSIVGLITGTLGFAFALGSLLLSLSLKVSDSFTPFLIFSAVSVFAGGTMLLLLGRIPTLEARPATIT